MSDLVDRLGEMWRQQRAFSEKLYDVGEMDEDVREAKTRELALAIHHDVSKLVACVNFRGHRTKTSPADRDRIVYEAVDVVRYAAAICNLWDFDDADFSAAWEDKELYLNMRLALQQRRWEGQPTLIWDVDDVLADFRDDFAAWVVAERGVHVDASSPEYFFIEQLESTGHSSLGLYDEFIRERRTATLTRNPAVDVLNRLHDEGAWVHLVTARPLENLTCRYDTYRWLDANGVRFDALDFTAEKLSLLTRTQYAVEGMVAACVDDGPNNVGSYVAHGFRTFMPVKPYNTHVRDDENLTRYTTSDELYDGLRKAMDVIQKV